MLVWIKTSLSSWCIFAIEVFWFFQCLITTTCYVNKTFQQTLFEFTSPDWSNKFRKVFWFVNFLNIFFWREGDVQCHPFSSLLFSSICGTLLIIINWRCDKIDLELIKATKVCYIIHILRLESQQDYLSEVCIETGTLPGIFFQGPFHGFYTNELLRFNWPARNSTWYYRKEALRCRFSSTSLRKTSLSIFHAKILKL